KQQAENEAKSRANKQAFATPPTSVPARGDVAVRFAAAVAKQLMEAARAPSAGQITDLIERYADVSAVALYALGRYRANLPLADRNAYFAGAARFVGRYAASEAPKYQVVRVEWANRSHPGPDPKPDIVMVDAHVVMADGSSYDVRCALTRHGTSFKLRDVLV